MAASVCLTSREKKHWWLTHSKRVVGKYIREAKSLIASGDPTHVASAIDLLDVVLDFSPRSDLALELKARSLLFLRRFKDVADLLQDYIPSVKIANEESSDFSSSLLSREGVKLLRTDSRNYEPLLRCLSVSHLKKIVLVRLCRNCEKEQQWRCIVLGQACSHLGLMEDAMLLLQTGKRLAAADFRRQSLSWVDDSFSLASLSTTSTADSLFNFSNQSIPESETVLHLLSDIKTLLRRRTVAIAALDAGFFAESIRQFTKIIDGRRAAPQEFLADCYMHRATAHKSAGQIAESISDCNKTLALDPFSILALETRALLLETIRCLPDSLHDLEHLKLLYNTILCDRKLPGPPWKRHNVSYGEIPGRLCALTSKIQRLKQRVANGETSNVDYYTLIGIRRGCSRSELERAYMLLCLRHKPEKVMSFINRCEFADENDVDSAKERAKMSTLLLYRLIQKGYSTLLDTVVEEEEAVKQRKKSTVPPRAAQAAIQVSHTTSETSKLCSKRINSDNNAFQGVFCRDITGMGNILLRAGLNNATPLSC